ncbi:2Fe-2S iron-sulfur cluster-binding protein [Micromonospora sp. HUAS LYJ1]|uniref:2Fe-2S iron-sulfur cluster-binding protein n=1 Tax=Micromonospora sp. HUAS LYJ1 TaxID=3061626 RepID=UPI002670E608|nr:2Fe-2S iron-sulfur cluster-binding protein [Micromonospora sp. HUAS LYJ1]WKU05592.1 FAD-binding oxidoreductase [Micromonospora sp. HUAS LYJ1]
MLHRLTTVDEVEALVGRPPSAVMLKQVGALDAGCRTVLAHSPIAAFGYRDTGGTSRTTFVGGVTGFARVHSPTRISFALPGAEAAPGPASMFFLLPGVGEVLRVNGTVTSHRGARTTVAIRQAYVHCAQAILRSGLWQPPTATAPAPEIAAGEPLGAPGVAEFLAAAPFLALSSWDNEGGSDTSPRGDRGTVVRVLDGRTLVLADRRGNKRADTLHNLLQDERLAFAALVPGRSGVLHVRGRGGITDDPALLRTLALRGLAPHAALVIDVEHAEVTGNDAVARARLWHPGAHLDRRAAPDLTMIALEHLAVSSADAPGGPPAVLIRIIGAIPGLSRLLRVVMRRAYRSGLRKEGYADLADERRADGGRAGSPLREVRIVEIRRETPTTVTLVLEDAAGRPGGFAFRPGQYFTLVVDVDGRPVRRAYSASSAPGMTRLEVTVKQVEGGRLSSHVHRVLRVGDRLALHGPSGTFHTEAEPPAEMLLVAAGSGVTPMMSMIRTRLADRAGRDRVALLYSSRDADEVIFAADLDRLAAEHPDRLSVTHVLTGRDGRLDTGRLVDWFTGRSPAADAHYYVCGPEALMGTVRNVLAGLDVPDARVHHETYASGAGTTIATTTPQPMTVEAAGQPVGTGTVEPGQSLLDAGLAAGIDLPFSCTVGTCGECVVRLRRGDVVLSEPNCLTPQQRAAGYTLTCLGQPLSEVTIDLAKLWPSANALSPS